MQDSTVRLFLRLQAKRWSAEKRYPPELPHRAEARAPAPANVLQEDQRPCPAHAFGCGPQQPARKSCRRLYVHEAAHPISGPSAPPENPRCFTSVFESRPACHPFSPRNPSISAFRSNERMGLSSGPGERTAPERARLFRIIVHDFLLLSEQPYERSYLIPTTNGCFCAWLGSRMNVPKIFTAKAVIPANSSIAETGKTDHAQLA